MSLWQAGLKDRAEVLAWVERLASLFAIGQQRAH